ncbi:alpha/beta hydrolase [Chloroflexota bacterium]
MKKEKLMFPCGDISLEGALWLPNESDPLPAVVVCHPHSLYGGNMNNNVVHEICIALSEHSIASLRFNFRGVGGSEGRFADGVGEQEDVKAALSFLESRKEIDSSNLALCGYSFGTMVSIPVADADERVQAYAGVSSFFIAPDLLQNFRKPKFFIHGKNDDLISPRQAEEIIKKLPDPKTFELVEGADHFWWGHDQQVGTKVGDFFTSCFS